MDKTTSAAYGLIDNVTLTYTGNQLTKADDAAASINLSESNDFKNYINTAVEYTYNKNGAMTKDLNKGITAIQYNSLNLPRLMDIKSPVAEARNEYLYSAAGAKLRVVQKWNPNYSTTPVIGSAINTGSLTMTKTTDYAGNMIYENNQLKRILIDGGYIEGSTYHFYLTDHLGNNRVVANASGTAVQRNHYYPFGMPYAETPITEQSKQPYKFGDKELDQMHGLNHYDFSARYMDGIRFTSVDPHAENYYSWSPYAYVGNNPIRITDPTGMDWWSTNNQDEIERILLALKSGEKVDTKSFGDDWIRVTDKELAKGMGIFDDVSLDYTIDGTSWRDYKGFGIKNIGGDYWMSMAGLGFEKTGGTFTMFMQQSLDKNKFLKQSFYSTNYSAREMTTKISLSKTRINIGSLGKTLGGVALGYTVIDSAISYRTGQTSSTDAVFNVGLGIISLKFPPLGITYGAVELLHPGGWAGWRESSSSLYKEIGHTRHGDQVFFGPKL